MEPLTREPSGPSLGEHSIGCLVPRGASTDRRWFGALSARRLRSRQHVAGWKDWLGSGVLAYCRAHSVRKKPSREGRSYPGAYHKKLDRSDNIQGSTALLKN